MQAPQCCVQVAPSPYFGAIWAALMASWVAYTVLYGICSPCYSLVAIGLFQMALASGSSVPTPEFPFELEVIEMNVGRDLASNLVQPTAQCSSSIHTCEQLDICKRGLKRSFRSLPSIFE